MKPPGLAVQLTLRVTGNRELEFFYEHSGTKAGGRIRDAFNELHAALVAAPDEAARVRFQLKESGAYK